MTEMTSSLRWLLLGAVVLLIATLAMGRVLTAASPGSGATGATDAPMVVVGSTALAPVGTTPMGCRDLSITFDRADPSVVLSHVPAIVRATVVDVDQTVRWATPTGAMPTGDRYLSILLTAYRTAHVRVTAVRSGSSAVGQVLSIRIQGGSFGGALNGSTDGCSTISIDGQADIVPGADVVLLFGRVPALGATPAATSDAIDAWPVTNGNVHEPDGSVVSAASLLLGTSN